MQFLGSNLFQALREHRNTIKSFRWLTVVPAHDAVPHVATAVRMTTSGLDRTR